MEINLYKAFSGLNAEYVDIGSKGYFADTLGQLEYLIENDCEEEAQILHGILNKGAPYRFSTGTENHAFFYLLKEPDDVPEWFKYYK